MNELQKIILETNKSYGREVIGLAKDMDVDIQRVSSGSLYLDWALGGGFPLGKVVEIFGPFSSGKTLICMNTIAQAQKLGLPCVFIDAEKTFEKKSAEAVGIDLSKLILLESSDGEQIFDFIRKLFGAESSGVLVIDSVAAIVPGYEEQNDMDKQSMGLTARLMSKGLRIINSGNKKWMIIFINQIREKIGVMYGSPETTTGGRALGFFASVRLKVTLGERYEKNDVRIGQEIKFQVQKSKVSRPWRGGSLRYMYDTGIDKTDEALAVGLEMGLIEQGGAWYTILGERFQGRNSIAEKFKEDPKFFEKYKEELYKKIDAELGKK